jgi:hypothetical protein
MPALQATSRTTSPARGSDDLKDVGVTIVGHRCKKLVPVFAELESFETGGGLPVE